MTADDGGRIVLRPLEESDAAALFEAIASSRPRLKRRMKWVQAIRTPDDCREFIRTSFAQSHDRTSLVQGVFEKKPQQLAGVAALTRMSVADGRAKMSLWIRQERMGMGLAVEAGRRLLKTAFLKEGLQRVYARIEPSNRAARRILQKLGFSYEGCLRREKKLNGRWVDQECWGLLKSEMKK
jgi:ribosomal-protein-serine acetyltransferase